MVLEPGDSTNCTASHEFDQAELNAGGNAACGLYNRVEATVTEINGFRWDELCIPVQKTPGLTVDKVSTTHPPLKLDHAPQTVSYSYLVSNTGNVLLTGLTVIDTSVSNMSCPGLLITGYTLAPGASTMCYATHEFTQLELDLAQTGVLRCPKP